MVKDVLFYFVLPIVALVICSLFGAVGFVIALILTLCVQVYTFRQSIENKKQIENLERNQKGLDDALHIEREDDGIVKGWEINAGDY